MAQRLSERLIKELPAPASGNRVTYDNEVPGFGVRVTAAGARSFVLNYRAAGRERRLTIGRFPAWSLDAARKEAKKRRQEIDTGADPLQARSALRSAPRMADLCDYYIEHHLPEKRTASGADDKAMIAAYIRPRLGAELVSAIDKPILAKLHREITAAKKPYRANRVMALLSKMFSLAMSSDLKWRTTNPARDVKRNPEAKRKRYLSPDEIARLTTALASHADQTTANIVRLLLLTGARRGEVLQSEWSQFDMKAGKWTKPAAMTKQNEEHVVPLSDGALALLNGILEAAPRDDEGRLVSSFVFPGPRSGAARTEIKDEWRAIALAAGLYDELPPAKPGGKPVRKVNCRVHDLRHTYASLLVSAGLSLPIIGALLGHTQASTTHRYAHLMDDPLRAATNTVSAVVTGKKSGDVVPIGERVA